MLEKNQQQQSRKKTERFVVETLVEIKKREKRTLLRASDLKFRDNLNIIQKMLLLQKPFCMLQSVRPKSKQWIKTF